MTFDCMSRDSGFFLCRPNYICFCVSGSDKTKQDAKQKAAEEMVYLLAAKNYLPCPRGIQVEDYSVILRYLRGRTFMKIFD